MASYRSFPSVTPIWRLSRIIREERPPSLADMYRITDSIERRFKAKLDPRDIFLPWKLTIRLRHCQNNETNQQRYIQRRRFGKVNPSGTPGWLAGQRVHIYLQAWGSRKGKHTKDMRSTIHYQKSHIEEFRQSYIALACKHIVELLNIMDEKEFEIFERQSLEALKLMLHAFHQAIKTYEERESRRAWRPESQKPREPECQKSGFPRFRESLPSSSRKWGKWGDKFRLSGFPVFRSSGLPALRFVYFQTLTLRFFKKYLEKIQ